MELKNVLIILEVLICLVAIISILLQQKEGGLSTAFGGSGGGESYRTKRGLELFLSRITSFVIVAFVVNSMALAYIN